MTTATFTHTPTFSLRRYLTDVSHAARALAAALFAAQERQFVAQEVTAAPVMSDRARARGRSYLFSLAKQYESTSPSLSAELRNLAARG